MRKVTNKIREKYTTLFDEYVRKYGEYYNQNALEFIKEHFLDVRFECEFDVDVLNQVYQEIGVFNKYPNNNYTQFYKLIRSRYDVNQHLLEPASGKFPSFAKMVAKKQKVGSVTVMDPDTIVSTLEGIKIIKEKLTSDFDASNYDFIYAIYPCEAMKPIIEVANKYDIEFCCLVCGCTHLPKEMLMYRREVYYREYLDYLESIMESTIPPTLDYKIEYTSGFMTPVISTKRKTMK